VTELVRNADDLPLPEPAAHMYPSDLDRFQTNETFATAYSVAAVPPGMALVPIEPTPGIITTGTVALMKASDSDLDATREEIAATYRAMIAAAGDKP